MKKQRTKKWTLLSLAMLLAAMPIFAACGAGDRAETVFIEEGETPLSGQPMVVSFRIPTASGEVQYTSGGVVMDASHTGDGYVMLQYSGSNSKIKVQITKGRGTTYTYDLKARKAYEVFPLSDGDGTYSVKVFENIAGTRYSQAFSKNIQVSLTDPLSPFLYPNQYVNFGTGSAVVAKGFEVTRGTDNQLKRVEKIYNYVVETLSYDKEKAATVTAGYLPEIDRILVARKGICFDYAAVMAAMLRSQNIPAKLVVGYAGDSYHAWINVYTRETGWVDSMIYFDGNTWHLMDPTFASSARKSKEIMSYIGDGKNYMSKYTY